MSVLFVEQNSNLCGGMTALSQQKKQQQQQQLSPSSHSAAASVNIEEQRALQLAFELSMLGLSDSLSTCNTNGGVVGNDMIVNMGMNDANSVCQQQSSPSSLSPNSVGVNGNVISANGLSSVVANNMGLSAFTTMLPNLDDRSKKSQNMTECVPVPSSEHVAEIVGRQGKFICILSSFLLYCMQLACCYLCTHINPTTHSISIRFHLSQWRNRFLRIYFYYFVFSMHSLPIYTHDPISIGSSHRAPNINSCSKDEDRERESKRGTRQPRHKERKNNNNIYHSMLTRIHECEKEKPNCLIR